MHLAEVKANICSGHDNCPARKAYPTKALFQMDPGEVVIVNSSLCRGCGDCVIACPERAIKMNQA